MSEFKKTLKDLTAGTAGGIAQVNSIFQFSRLKIVIYHNQQVLVGQPFDIVKVVRRSVLRR